MKRTFIPMCAFVLLLGLPNARGQSISPSTLNATGGSGIIGSNEFDWSIGEMALVSTFTGSSVIVTQGVLQPATGNVGIQTPSLGDRLQVFPNPASTVVNLQYTAATPGSLNYRLMDMAGKTVMARNIEIQQGEISEQLNIAQLAQATYMLEISFKTDNAAEETTSYKIEKLK